MSKIHQLADAIDFNEKEDSNYILKNKPLAWFRETMDLVYIGNNSQKVLVLAL